MRNIIIKNKEKFIAVILAAILTFPISYYSSHYDYLVLNTLIVINFILLFIAIVQVITPSKKNNYSTKEILFILAFSITFSMSLVFGLHIDYAGNYDTTYSFSSFTVLDTIMIFFISIACFFIFTWIYSFIKNADFNKKNNPQIYKDTNFIHVTTKWINNKLPKNWTVRSLFFNNTKTKKIDSSKLNKVLIIVGIVIGSLCMLPYLLTYNPGLIYTDSLYSITAVWPYNNLHPVLYTSIVQACLHIACLFNLDHTAGYNIYCMLQIIIYSFGISYMCAWIVKRMRLRIFVFFILELLLLCPYFASYSITFLKDPIFSVVMIFVTLGLFDIVFSIKDKKKITIWRWLTYSVLLLILSFIRNNGFYIVLFIFACLLIYFVVDLFKNNKKNNALLKSVVYSFASIIIALIIFGPGFKLLGIESTKSAEYYGNYLNQIASVVVNDGNLDQEDIDFINKLCPIEDIKDNYNPFLVDKFKWSPRFKDDGITSSEEFLKGYLRIFNKNKEICIDQIMCLNCGYWVINIPAVWDYDESLTTDIPRDYFNAWEKNPDMVNEADIHYNNFFDDEAVYDWFPIRNKSIPVSVITWSILFLVIVCYLLKRAYLIIPAAPILGLIISLIVASPIWYWPRYALAVQLLFIFFIYLYIILRKRRIYLP